MRDRLTDSTPSEVVAVETGTRPLVLTGRTHCSSPVIPNSLSFAFRAEDPFSCRLFTDRSIACTCFSSTSLFSFSSSICFVSVSLYTGSLIGGERGWHRAKDTHCMYDRNCCIACFQAHII